MTAMTFPLITRPTIDAMQPDRLGVVGRPTDPVDGVESADERAVAAGLVAGDAAALEAAFRHWGDLVHAMARQLVGRDDADDVVQQVFVQAWRSRETFDPARGEVPGWLVGITRNLARNHHRRRGRAALVLVEDPEQAESQPARDDEVAMSLLIASAMRELPDEQREVVELSLLRDHTQIEVADLLGVPLGTVKSRQRRGLARLRRVLEGAR